jgi:RNA polymerase sigma factor (sigma-70 family)
MAIDSGNQTDRQLLKDFTDRKDEEAFAELVRKHGPMVLGVCRRMLRNQQDAEDTFQATFLVLARKAGSVRNPEALPNWLYGVATRLAIRSRRRRTREEPLLEPSAVADRAGRAKDELEPVLHEEIGLLPDKFRIPVILCYLDGKTNEEAALHIGCPAGTVFSRLARARKRLRDRLARRGLIVSSGLFSAVLADLPGNADAAVPTELAAATVDHAVRFSNGGGEGVRVVPNPVLELATRHLRATHGWRFVGLAITLCLGTAFCVIGGMVLSSSRAEKPIVERLQGKWVLQSMNIGGRLTPGAQLGESWMKFTGDQVTSMFGGLVPFSATYRIDAEKNPKRLNWSGPPAIFILEGETLTICIGHEVDGRPPDAPTDFTPGPHKSVMVFERERPAQDGPGKGAQPRTAWLFSASRKNGSFRNESGNQWIEKGSDGVEVHFEEVERADKYVELFDPNRAMSLRLYSDHAEWRQGGSGPWNRLYEGHWEAAGDLPNTPK